MEVRPFDPEQHMEGLQRLFMDVLERPLSPEVWRWKYRPPWTTRTFEWAGFDGGDLIAHTGAVQLRGWVRGAEVPFIQLADIVVHPRMRARYEFLRIGPMRLLAEIEESLPACVYYGFTGRRTARFYCRMGGTIVEEARDRLVPADAAQGAAVVLEPLSFDDPALDALWDRLRPDVGLIKDRTWLDWRYVRYPLYRHRLLGVRREGELVGWLVLAEAAFEQGRAEEVRILDQLLAPELIPGAMAAAARLAEAKAAVFWHAGRGWGGESRETSWVAVVRSRVEGCTSDEMADGLSYALGEADEWWW
jgi:hypothetical protein